MLRYGINIVATINVDYQFQIEVAVCAVALDVNENNACTFSWSVNVL